MARIRSGFDARKLTRFAAVGLATFLPIFTAVARKATSAPNTLTSEEETQGWRLLFNGQDLARAGRVDPAGDHHGHRDDPSFDPDLLKQGIDPEEGILFGQRASLEVLDLGVKLLVELRDLGSGDVLDAHRVGQTLDLPG